MCTLLKADEADGADISVTISGAEMKKEISTISGILLDLPDDDQLKEDLGQSQAKLTKLARKHLGSVPQQEVYYFRTLS